MPVGVADLSAYKGTIGLKAAKSDKQQVIFDVSPAVIIIFVYYVLITYLLVNLSR